MRRTFNDKQILKENGQFIGVVLGYDFCAEHEWGISGIKRDFGIPHKPNHDCYGLEARTITEVPGHYTTREDKQAKEVLLAPVLRWHADRTDTANIVSENQFGRIYDGDPFAAAWSEDYFGLRVKAQDRYIVDELYAAMQRKDLAIFGTARTNTFGGSGLALVIPSRVSDASKQLMAEGDLENIALEAAAQATGIHAKLEEAGCRYYALSPRWSDETKTEVVFWLNPMEQQRNNSGWFSVAELEAWTRSEGRIPKQTATR